ncbi:hypothetical protein VOLCADRAFT_82311 [Volvox carteri f. nagariensis]|uniref:CoA carboxyltransferase N-terminal domain-containing protein n=1 Tax=Volvox carteri f. nagariensis TaxID=3068 RepID=D8U455_VOLCA|nr:uncharacterized protein VOLCADRAFT_82311 [Volvox carteri f. nagariensis]EFJ45535.1 hypothetical protein VOLCADRAFT_82311 [Volvox carteri f. nagariensis]|eukprot:XP_002953562.1 hypothetical protein VOLCADRAFT_82311 [Volvox carteri f. nagariensis]
MLSAGSSKSCCVQRGCNGPKLATLSKLVAGHTTGRAGVSCRAEVGETNGIVSGPIAVNPSMSPALDPVSAASDGSKGSKAVDRSKGLWTRCDKCGTILYIKHLKEHHHICFGCNYHLKMSSQERINHLIDAGTWRALDETLSPVDPLEFTDLKPYTDRIKEAQEKTGLQDGVRTGTGLLHGIPVALGVMDFTYMGGSMGSVVGEKLTRLIEYATQEGMPVIIVCTSGGARMQEGIFSLMQMAKISAALHVHQTCANLLYIAILTSPTTGGVTASFGMLGDVIIAEPQAIIGFAGRRVIEQTLQEQLPDDFQTAEYLLEHGLLDLVVPRSFLKGALYEIIDFYRAAPYKRRGTIPYGVQQGTFLTTEEKVRRRWAQWGRNGNGNGKSEQLMVASDSAAVSYRELVNSFRALVASEPGSSNGASHGAAAPLDLQELLSDPEALPAAMDLAKGSKIEWMLRTEKLLTKQEQEAEYVFRVK